MEKKKLLFSCYGLGIGGIEKCLVNLVNKLDEEKYDIDALLMNPETDLKDQIVRNITFLESTKYIFNSEDSWQVKRKATMRIPQYYIFRIVNKLGIRPWMIFKKLHQEYDVAIAYSQNDFSPYYIIDKVKAKRKILWYHNGAYLKTEKNYARDKKYYSKFDYIVAVSAECKRNLEKYFPELKSKIIVIHNIVDEENIIKQAQESFDENIMEKQAHVIMTVGRMTKEKGPDLAVEVCEKLLQSGYQVKWYWIGDGNQSNLIKEKIREKGLERAFILLGNKTNPYKYMSKCDLYVQPSYYEAYCTTTNEARILSKIVVATDVGGMREQIINGETGFIVDINVESIYEKIKELIDNPVEKKKIQENLINQTYEFSNYIKEYEVIFE